MEYSWRFGAATLEKEVWTSNPDGTLSLRTGVVWYEKARTEIAEEIRERRIRVRLENTWVAAVSASIGC